MTNHLSAPYALRGLFAALIFSFPQLQAESPVTSEDRGGGVAGKSQQLSSPDQVPEGLAKSDWQSIRAAHKAWEHSFLPTKDGWQARNAGQQWTTQFDGRGFLAKPKAAEWQWGLELRSYGFGQQQRAVQGKPVVKAEGQRLSYQWDADVQEWFVNDQRGLEHGFTVARRPAGAAADAALEVVLGTRGTLKAAVAADAQTIYFRDGAGAPVVTYAGLKVWDADGQVLPSRFMAGPEGGIILRVDESAARYPITIDPIAQQAYLKPLAESLGYAGVFDQFGYSVAVSGDTVVVGANNENSSSTGINSTPDEGSNDAGAAYVFVRSGGTWSQQAYLKASQVTASDQFGLSVAVDGDTVVVGAYQEDSSTTGINSTPDELASAAGAAYVFVRSGGTWSQQAYLKAAQVTANDQFGWSVAVSGDTVVVGAPGEDSSTTGINSTPDELASAAGAAYVFVRSGGTWSRQAYLKASQVTSADLFGRSVSVSGDTVVVGSMNEDSSTTGINSTPNELASASGAAYVFVRSSGTWSQQAYLKASQVSVSDSFGFSVAVDGDTVVVGAYQEDSSTTGINSTPNESAFSAGAAYVFVRSGSTWSQQAYLKASQVTASDIFGYAVAVSGDTVVVGAYLEDSGTGINTTPDEAVSGAGAAYVFVRSSGTWSQQAYLKASNISVNDNFGLSVSVSGETVVVGAYGEDSSTTGINGTPNDVAGGAGAAYVFVRSSSTWTQQAFVKPSQQSLGYAGVSDNFGSSVAVDEDTVVVGAVGDSSSTPGINSTPDELATASGAAYVFVRSNGTWSQQAYLKASNVSGSDQFGVSVAVDGDTVVVGASREDSSTTGINSTPNDNENDSGAVYVFLRSGVTWSQQAYLKASQVTSGDQFGVSVAVSGNTAVVGAFREDSSTTGINSTPNDNETDTGAAYVFVRSGGTWSQQAYLKGPQVNAYDQFGFSVAVSGDTAVVGASGDDSSTTGINSTPNENALDAGAAYVFVRSGSTWSQQAYLKASQVSVSDSFGFSVAVDGDTVVVGAYGEDSSTTGINSTPDEGASASGAAYVFVRSGSIWSQQAYLKASQVTADDNFGYSVAMSGDTLVVGARQEDSSTTGINSTPNESATDAGAAYVFVRSGSTWSQQAYLKAGQVTGSDFFGFTVAVSGDTVVVGAYGEDGSSAGINNPPTEGASNAGAAYIFSGLGMTAAAPTVTNVAPATGSTAGGTVVTITGTDFTDASAVTFGGTNATSFTVDSATQITATTPARAAGAVSVEVTTPGGTNVANTLFTYFDPILTAAYSSATDVPVTAAGYTASGKTVNLSLGFAPTAGTQLTVVNNTGLAFINGVFDNLAQGQTVTLSFGGEDYEFVANYYGGTGNDLVLVWKNNRVLAWGNGSFGKLGNSSTADSSVPVAVTQTGVLNGKTVIAGAAGDSHSIVLCSDGTVLTWGRNNNGQLGNNSTTDSSVPVAVTQTGVLSGKTVIAVTVGIAHSLALCSDGTLAAWGSNGEGRLGNNSTTQSTVPVAVTMTGVLSGKTVVAIAAGASHNLVLCSDGTLAAWGLNTDGQLGNNSTTNSLVPVAVTQTGVLSGKTVTAITAGYVHNVVLCSDGTLASWGNGAVGRLGHGLNTGSSVPVAVTQTGVLSGKTVSALATGAYHSVVLCTDGTLAAWGFNTYGQLGNNTLTNSNVPVLVTQTGVLSGKTVVAVKGGGYQAFALCSDGTVTSWGRNNLGQLGDNTLTNSSVPVVVDSSVLAAGERFNKLLLGSAESQHSLALAAAPATPPIPAPTVTNVAPATGSTAGGTSVVITGTGFTGASAVTFGGTNATSFTVNSATQITATTPARAAGAVSVLVTTPGGTNAANTLYTYATPNTVPRITSRADGSSALSSVLARLDTHQANLRALVPSSYAFIDGVTGTSIEDGGEDMYDTGNVLNTSAMEVIPYSNGVISTNSSISYFTRKHTGLFAFVADLNGATNFYISGDLGADGSGFTSKAVLTRTVGGVTYKGFLKRVYGTTDPSVNQLIIVQDRPGLSQTAATDTNEDLHTVSGLSGSTRLYYLLFASSAGGFVSDAVYGNIMDYFLQNVVTSSLTREAGFAAASVPVATVSDAETAAGSLTVTATTVPAGINVTGITNSAGTISAIVTADSTTASGQYTVVLTVSDGSLTANANLGVRVVAVTRVDSISPTSGSTAGGTSVTLTGTGFTGASAVTFGGINATSFTVNSATQITAVTPAGSAGTASVLVTTPGGTNAANTLFTYDAPATYGYDVPLNTSSGHSPGFLLGYRITVTAPGPLSSFGLILTAASPSNASFGLYTDVAGAPDTLVAQTGSFNISAGGRVEAPPTAPVRLNPGDYWIMAVFDGTPQIGHSSTIAATTVFRSLAFTGSLPTTFGPISSYSGTAANYYIKVGSPPNAAPVITSNGGDATASINVAENSTAVTTVTATDTNTPAQTLTYTKSGADAGFFTLNPTSGALSFTSAPNFEAPADSGLNNIYEVTVTVTDSGTPGLTDTQAISVIVTDVNEGPAIKPSSSYLAYETVNPTRDGSGLIVYTTNNAATLAGLPFNRVRYRMDNTTGGVAYYADASFDAWSGLTVDGLKVPDAGNILTTQRNVTNVSIRSNHPRVVNSNTELGRLEQWTNNYSPPGIIGGSATLFDYDDTPHTPILGYGSFQLHNLSATVPETVFAWNNHAAGVIPDVGFGNATTGIHPDWTFSNTGTNAWRMQIYIENNFVPPTMSFTEDVVGNILFFNSPFQDDSASLTVTLSIADGTITGNAGTGITVGGTAISRTFSGSVADLNAYFTTPGKVTYLGALNNTVSRTLTVTVSDGSLSTFTTSTIHLAPVNDAPAVVATLTDTSWTPASAMSVARIYHTATRLSDGRVLVAGGTNGATLSTAEIYDPSLGTWTATGSMPGIRQHHKAVRLLDGRVLVSGGYDASGVLQTSALYNPATGTWAATGNLNTPRVDHVMTLLPNGKVLMAGGRNSSVMVSPAEIYDPATGLWTTTGSLLNVRWAPTATLLTDGRVLIAGGDQGAGNAATASAEIYNPTTGTWTATGGLSSARYVHAAALLPNGKVLVAGGFSGSATRASAELYDPASGTWSVTGTMSAARGATELTPLADGQVLISSGRQLSPSVFLASAEIYNPALGTWTTTSSLGTARQYHTSTALADGRVLVTGGEGNSVVQNTSEIFAPRVAGAEGATLTQTGTFSDADGTATVTLTASSGTVTQNNTVGTWSWSPAVGFDGPSSSTVTITATDSGSAVAKAAFTFVPTNAVPTVQINPPTTLLTNVALNFQFVATDAATADQAAGFAWSINFGDGSGVQSAPAGTASPYVRSHTYTQSGNYVVTATATDKDSGVSIAATASVTILGSEIAVTGNGNLIVDGDSTPALADHTDFGSVSVSSGSISRTFTIANTGSSALNLTGTAPNYVTVSGSTDFVVTTQPTTPIAATSGSSMFVVTFNPSSGGIKNAMINIANDDADETPYNFAITGEGQMPEPIPSTLGDVVTAGDAPGANGTTNIGEFSVLRRGGFLAENGHLVFPGFLQVGSGSPAVTVANASGIWKIASGNLFLLARTGTVVPDLPGTQFATVPEAPGLSETGEASMLSTLVIGSGGVTSANDTGLWSEIGGGGLRLLLREDDNVPSLPGVKVGSFASGLYATARTGASTGEAVFSVTYKGASTKTALLRTSVSGATTTVSVVAQEGEVAPGTSPAANYANVAGSYSDPGRMDAQGNFVYSALTTPGNKEGIWYQPVTGGTPSKVFFAGETAPGTGGATFARLQRPSMGSNGFISFRATLNRDGDNAANARNDGIWNGSASNPASFTCVLRRGDGVAKVSNLPVGSLVGNPWGGWLTNSNLGAWRAWLDVDGDGISSTADGDVNAIFANLSGAMQLAVKVGDAAPGTAGASFSGFDLPMVGGNNQYAILGNLTGGDTVTGNNQGLWKSGPNGGALTLAIRKGESIPTTEGPKVVTKIDVPGSNQTDRRWEQPVMDSTGRMVVYVTFADGSTSQVILP